MSLADALTGLDNQRKALAANLVAKGVQATGSETLAQLVPKVLTIPQEGGGGSCSMFGAIHALFPPMQNFTVAFHSTTYKP